MVFKPGQIANPNGARKERQFYTALQLALRADDRRGLRQIAEKLVDLAVKGEPWAIQCVADRLDGKPAQTVDSNVTVNAGETLERFMDLVAQADTATIQAAVARCQLEELEPSSSAVN